MNELKGSLALRSSECYQYGFSVSIASEREKAVAAVNRLIFYYSAVTFSQPVSVSLPHALISNIDCLDLSAQMKIINTRRTKDTTSVSKLIIPQSLIIRAFRYVRITYAQKEYTWSSKSGPGTVSHTHANGREGSYQRIDCSLLM